MKRNISFLSADGITNIHGVEWVPDTEPKAVIQLVHGMVEYIERYDTFARFLNEQGFLVVGHDHLGHGQAAAHLPAEQAIGFIRHAGHRGQRERRVNDDPADVQRPYHFVPSSFGRTTSR